MQITVLGRRKKNSQDLLDSQSDGPKAGKAGHDLINESTL
jgi:hypothetical protein